MQLFSDELLNKYEFVNHGHAAEILQMSYPKEWKDISDALLGFTMKCSDITTAGGSGTAILEQFDALFVQQGWKNTMIQAKLRIMYYERLAGTRKYSDVPFEEHDVNNYVVGPRVDYLRNSVGMCLEWNKKDIAFDRDLASLRSFYELDSLGAGVIITRSDELDKAFDILLKASGSSIKSKYGASTTHLGKLIPRLDSNQVGGCPILAIGIRSGCITDLEDYR